MSDISKINVDGVDYDVKDTIARDKLLKTALPTVSTSDNGKILKVVNGVWTAVAE